MRGPDGELSESTFLTDAGILCRQLERFEFYLAMPTNGYCKADNFDEMPQGSRVVLTMSPQKGELCTYPLFAINPQKILSHLPIYRKQTLLSSSSNNGSRKKHIRPADCRQHRHRPRRHLPHIQTRQSRCINAHQPQRPCSRNR